jgi:hypothetical protein
MQAVTALAKGSVLHDPQWALSVLRFASQPLLATPSQLPNLQGEGRQGRAVTQQPHGYQQTL